VAKALGTSTSNTFITDRIARKEVFIIVGIIREASGTGAN
jgi:hypothetical protein